MRTKEHPFALERDDSLGNHHQVAIGYILELFFRYGRNDHRIGVIDGVAADHHYQRVALSLHNLFEASSSSAMRANCWSTAFSRRAFRRFWTAATSSSLRLP